MLSSCLTSCSVPVAQIPIGKHRLPRSRLLRLAWSIQPPRNRCWGTLPAGTRSQSGPARRGAGWRRFTRLSYLISRPHLGILLTPRRYEGKTPRTASTHTYGTQSRTRPLYIHTAQQIHTLDIRILTRQLRHRNTLTHNWRQAEQSCGFPNTTCGGVSHPAAFCCQAPGPTRATFSSPGMKEGL